MAITLKTLLQVAPFPEDQRKIILDNYDKLTDQDKRELSVTGWTALTTMYRGRVMVESQKLLKEIQTGKRTYNKKDFDNVKEQAFNEFAKKFDTVETTEDIQYVRAELAKHLKPNQQFVANATHKSSPSGK